MRACWVTCTRGGPDEPARRPPDPQECTHDATSSVDVGGAPDLPDCGSFRIFTGKDGITWQGNTGSLLLSSVRKRPGWRWRRHGRSWMLPASSGLTRRRLVIGCGLTVRSTPV